MAVKDLNVQNSIPVAVEKPKVRPITLSSLNSSTIQSTKKTDLVSIESESSLRQTQIQQRMREKINQAIEATNIAVSAVDDIEKIFGGIEGIVEQVNTPDFPTRRVPVLEKEAQSLRQELSKTAERSASDGTKPLSGDKIRLEIEATLGKALEIIFPDKARGAFGLDDLALSPKDLIIDTITKLKKAREGIEDLKNKVNDGADTVKAAVLALDVAQQNKEASQVSIRDVDEALQLALDTKINIRKDPSDALNSVGDIEKEAAVELLS